MMVTAVVAPSIGTTMNPSKPLPVTVRAGMPTGKGPVRMLWTPLAATAAPFSALTTR